MDSVYFQVDWLNKFLKDIWPYLDKVFLPPALTGLLKRTMEVDICIFLHYKKCS